MKAIAATAVAVAILLGFAAPEIKLYYALQRTGQPNPEHPSIIMLGDSHTEFVNWRVLLDCPNIANFGIGGNTTSQILDRVQSVIRAGPKAVFLMAGTNDAIDDQPAHLALSNIAEIKATLASNQIEMFLQTPPPLPTHEKIIAQISAAATVKIPFTESDLLSDRVHLRRSGYAKWRDAIQAIVHNYC